MAHCLACLPTPAAPHPLPLARAPFASLVLGMGRARSASLGFSGPVPAPLCRDGETEAQRGIPLPTVRSVPAGSRPLTRWPRAPSGAWPGREGRPGSLAFVLLAGGPRKGPREARLSTEAVRSDQRARCPLQGWRGSLRTATFPSANQRGLSFFL